MTPRRTRETYSRQAHHNSHTLNSARDEVLAQQTALSVKEKEDLLQATNAMGDRITTAMEDNGISNRELSVLMDVGERTVSDWKKDGTISLKRLPLLARHLNTSVEYLITGETSDYLKPHSGDANVVEFQRQAKHEGVNMPLIDRFLPAVSTAEIQKGKDFVHEIIKANAQSTGERIGMSVAFWNEDVPGIPKYAIQMIIEDHKEDLPMGTLMGIADDISPIPGDYVIGNKDDEFVSGFFFPVDAHLATNDRAGRYKKLKKFVLRRRLNSECSSDIICTHENFELVGVCTYSANWRTPSLLEEQTRMRDRMKKAFESRRLDD